MAIVESSARAGAVHLESPSRLSALDGLRAFAVLLVFVHHVDQRALPGGFLGVELFFALSGFLITDLLLTERDRTGSIDLRKFYMRRALRLYPALLALAFVLVPVSYIESVGYPLLDGLAALLYLSDIYSNVWGHLSFFLHTWSLSVEEQFYFGWPILLLVGLARGWRVRTVAMALAVSGLLIAGLLNAADISRFHNIQFQPMSHLPELCGGILLAFALKTRAIRCGDFLAVGALVALLVALPFVKSEGWWIYGAAAPVCLLLVAHLVTNRSSWISRAFAWRPAVWLGERSYGFYLWHYPVLLMLHLHHATIAVCVVIALPVTLMLTELSWRVVEQPFLRLKRRYQVVRYDDGDDSHGGGFPRRHSSIRRVVS